jgi:hypothetical protein
MTLREAIELLRDHQKNSARYKTRESYRQSTGPIQSIGKLVGPLSVWLIADGPGAVTTEISSTLERPPALSIRPGTHC